MCLSFYMDVSSGNWPDFLLSVAVWRAAERFAADRSNQWVELKILSACAVRTIGMRSPRREKFTLDLRKSGD